MDNKLRMRYDEVNEWYDNLDQFSKYKVQLRVNNFRIEYWEGNQDSVLSGPDNHEIAEQLACEVIYGV